MARIMGVGCVLWESELGVLQLNVERNFENLKVFLFMYIPRQETLRQGISISHEVKVLKGGDYSRKNHWRWYAISRRELHFSSW